MRAFVCAAVLLAACSRSSTPPGPVAILDRVPAGASFVIGVNRMGSEAELGKLYQEFGKAMGGQIPGCALTVYAKVESLVLAVNTKTKPVTFSLAAHGAGLRKGAEDCLKETTPEIKVTQEGPFTQYAVPDDKSPVRVRWIDDGTVVFSGKGSGTTTEASDPSHPLSKDPDFAKLVGDIDTRSGSWFVGDLGALPADLQWPSFFPRPLRVQLDLGGGGGKDARAVLTYAAPAEATSAAERLKAMLAAAPKEITAGDPRIEVTADKVVVKLAVGKLIAQMAGMPEDKLPPAVMSSAGIGILAAIAVPAFMKNARKSKTAEAVVNVKKIFDGARSYYEENKKFPPSAAESPPIGSCCPTKCAPDAKLWAGETWGALNFSMDDPHYYSYAYKSEGSTFTVTARGDLDCDGTYSTFEMKGEIKEDDSVTGGAGMFRDQELE